MLTLLNGVTLEIETDDEILDFDELITASDIKKLMRENDSSFAYEASKLILVAIDDNGNSYYVNK